MIQVSGYGDDTRFVPADAAAFGPEAIERAVHYLVTESDLDAI